MLIQEVKFHASLTLALDECDWSVLRTDRIFPGEESPVPTG